MSTYLTVHETAKRLGISVPTVYRLIDRGELPSVKIGRARRIPLERLDSFLARQTVPYDTDSLSASCVTER
jgi:excisionase family DNA binding protein